ncbi:HesA/MoeB/ThiF family protein [Candidatus Woesearchaeota archaeon]|nr:HesA/MoeB/ThiF family protein [Candidatus Woesearchaeota archaeon]
MRYSRQIILDKIGKKGQQILCKSCVAVVGIGALGSTCVQLLARAGLGKIILVDKDKLELHNLQRQLVYNEDDVGKIKALQAETNLKKINSEIEIIAENITINKNNIDQLKESDLILGCTDNLESRFLINEFSLKKKIPWIHGGAVKTTGNLLNILPGEVCFRCVFSPVKNFNETADTVGIINSIPVIIGALQATQAIKILLKKEYEKDLIYFDVWNNEFNKINVKKNKNCPACNGKWEILK